MARGADRPARYVRSWTDDELIAELRAWLEVTPRPSTHVYAQDRASNPELPPLSTVCHRFGGWHEALREAGHAGEPRPTRRYRDNDILNAIREWMDGGGDGRAATYSSMAKTAGLPSFNTVYLRFGSWRAALVAAEHRTRRTATGEVVGFERVQESALVGSG